MVDSVQIFLDTYYSDARKNEKITNVPALVALAQSSIETGFAKSKPGNMMFGVKAGPHWTGKKQLLRTTEYLTHKNGKFPYIISIDIVADGPNKGKYRYVVKDWFRAYDSPLESFLNYGKFLNENDRYKKAFDYVNDPVQFAREIARAGYATARNYEKVLVERVQLFQKKK